MKKGRDHAEIERRRSGEMGEWFGGGGGSGVLLIRAAFSKTYCNILDSLR